MFDAFNIEELAPQVKKVINHPILEFARSQGGFIAGGFGRCAVFHPEKLFSYLLSPHNPGDIDLFFPDRKSYEASCEFASLYCQTNLPAESYPSSSVTGFCTNVAIPAPEFFTGLQMRERHRTIKIQLVNVFHGNPRDVLDTFDIENCKVALGREFVTMSDSAGALERSKTIKVVHDHSPLLPIRIRKYMNARGLENVHTHSAELMRNWIINWLHNRWDGHPLACMFTNHAAKSYHKDELTRLLRHEKLITTDQLSLLFGALNYQVRERYGYSTYWRHVDPVRDELKRRNI